MKQIALERTKDFSFFDLTFTTASLVFDYCHVQAPISSSIHLLVLCKNLAPRSNGKQHIHRHLICYHVNYKSLQTQLPTICWSTVNIKPQVYLNDGKQYIN